MTAVYAHRGCTVGYAENTLEAFAEAKRLGADGVELDVRLTADGALAVHHDPVIAGLGPVADLTVSDLPAHVPLLADALAVCDGLVVDVEIKNDPAQPGYDPGESVAALTAAAMAEAGWTERVIVSSFQASTLRAAQVADGRLRLGALWSVFADADAAVGPGRRGGVVRRPSVRHGGQPRSGRAGPPGRPGRQRLDGQLPPGPRRPRRAGRGRGHHRPPGQRPVHRPRRWQRRVRGGDPGATEWREGPQFVKDERP